MLQDDPSALATAQALQATQTTTADTTGAIVAMSKIDSTTHATIDSLKSLNSLSDMKAVMTGENTILRDALSSLAELTAGFIPKLIGAIIVLWIGLKLIKILKRTLCRIFERSNTATSLNGFITSFVDVIMKVMLVIMVMDIIGIKATSFIAVLGAMGLAIGMALQGTLQNFAGGVIILLLKPFNVGDYIECGSYKGYVRDIRIFHTIIRPFNGRTIIVPNSELATKSLINHTKEPILRLDVVVGVAYGTDLAFAKQVLYNLVNSNPLVLQEPKKPAIAVSELNNSSVDLTLWLWTKTEDYWTLWEVIREEIYNALNENGIEIPFPQVSVHQKTSAPDTNIPTPQAATTVALQPSASTPPNPRLPHDNPNP